MSTMVTLRSVLPMDGMSRSVISMSPSTKVKPDPDPMKNVESSTGGSGRMTKAGSASQAPRKTALNKVTTPNNLLIVSVPCSWLFQ